MALPNKPDILNRDRDSLDERGKKAWDEARAAWRAEVIRSFDLIRLYTHRVRKPERPIVGREGIMAAMLAAFERPELSNVLLLAEAGSGKALVDDTPIPVADARGFVPIGSLRVGDEVFAQDGRPTRVLGVYPQGSKRVWRISFEDGSVVFCNDEHLWECGRDDGEGQVEFSPWTIRQMLKVDDGRPWRVPLPGPVERPDALLRSDPWLLGAFFATYDVHEVACRLRPDAFFRVGTRMASSFGCHAMFLDGEGAEARWQLELEEIDGLAEGVRASFSGDASDFERAALGSLSQRLAFLKGAVSAAGLVEGGHAIIEVASRDRGAEEWLCHLASSIGIRARAMAGAVRLLGPEELVGPLLEDAGVDAWDVECPVTADGGLAIEAIEDTGAEREMTCIYVEDASHVFLCEKTHVPTHNTALVQGLSVTDTGRIYLEVDLARMIAAIPDTNALAASLKLLFDQVEDYNKLAGSNEAVLFMDEFHQIVQISSVAVEALKPLLADSGARGIRVICATTYREFRDYISKNQPLVERLQRINVPEPGEKEVVEILRGMAERYKVAHEFGSDRMFQLIYEYTQRYVPANAQPRKSLLILDAMIGWHRATGRPLDMKLLADVIYESEGVNVAFRVDAASIKNKLDKRVFAQDFATSVVAKRLQICVADLNDHTKPMSSMLLTGSTGTGKALFADELVPVCHRGLKGKDETCIWKRAGDVREGDWLFGADGFPASVLGVFPQGERELWRVWLSDGRSLCVTSDHLWEVKDALGRTRVVRTSWLERVAGTLDAPSIAVSKIVSNLGARGEIASDDRVRHLGRRLGREGAEGLSDHIFGARIRRRDLLQGVVEGLGTLSVEGGQVSFTMDSLAGADAVRTLARTIGLSAMVCGVREPGADALAYRIRLFGLARELRAVFPGVGGIASGMGPHAKGEGRLGVRAVERLGRKGEAVCFYVRSDDHTFVAGKDCVLTHNTELSKQLAKLLFDDERALIRLDMTEFANADSLERFRDEITTRVWERPFCIVLLDEIEKACPEVTRLLLQVLDDGRLSDRNGRETSFLNAYIIMTTNVASEIYRTIAQYRSDDTGSASALAGYEKVIRRSITKTAGEGKFPPELVGRIDCLVPFQPLSAATQGRIVETKLRALRTELRSKHDVDMQVDGRVIRYLVEDSLDTDSDAGGARAVMAKFQDEVVASVAAFVNANPRVRAIGVFVEGTLASENKSLRVGDAKIVVKPRRIVRSA